MPLRPTKTKQKSRNPFDEPIKTNDDTLAAKKGSQVAKKNKEGAPDLEKAKKPARPIEPTDHMKDLLNKIDGIEDDDISDQEAGSNYGQSLSNTKILPNYNLIPTKVANDLVVINKDLTRITPKWYTVSSLPGYLSNLIRSMGRGIFKLFSNTPLEDIVVLANVNGQGPNKPQELTAVIKWLKDHALDRGPSRIDFSKVMPGYNPESREFETANTRFLVIRDEFGYYIYAFPEKDAKF